MTTNEYESELTADRGEIAAILEGVADGLRAGTVRVGDGPDAVSVETPDELTLEVELESGDDERSLELELEWPVTADTADIEGVSVDEADVEAPVGPADGPRTMARFEVFQGRDAQWRWRLRHRNGNVIATGGEGYTRKHNALKGLRSVVANVSDAAIATDGAD